MSEGLHGFEFDLYLKKVPLVYSCFQSVYSLDEIPKSLSVRKFIVVNLSKSNETGTHWIVIIRSHKQIYEVFNSLGFHDLNVILPYMQIRSKADVVFNQQMYQSSTSSTCGLFCIYYAINRVLNFDLSFHHLLEHIFDDDIEQNESHVINFCQNLKQNSDDGTLFDTFV